MLGNCNRVIARLPVQIYPDKPATKIRPSHQKWGYGYSIGMLEPDVVAQVDDDYGYPKPHLDEAYPKVTIRIFPLYLRTDFLLILLEVGDQHKNPEN